MASPCKREMTPHVCSYYRPYKNLALLASAFSWHQIMQPRFLCLPKCLHSALRGSPRWPPREPLFVWDGTKQASVALSTHFGRLCNDGWCLASSHETRPAIFHDCIPLTQGSWHFPLSLMNPIKSQAETIISPPFSCMWLPHHHYFRRIPQSPQKYGPTFGSHKRPLKLPLNPPSIRNPCGEASFLTLFLPTFH